MDRSGQFGPVWPSLASWEHLENGHPQKNLSCGSGECGVSDSHV